MPVYKVPLWENRPGFDRETGTFNTPDPKGWAEKQGIAKDAETRGQDNQPPSDARALGDQEKKIVAWINQCARICRQDVTNFLSDLLRDLADKKVDDELQVRVQEIDEIKASARTDLAHQVDQGLDQLASPATELRKDEDDYANFCVQEGLHRSANYAHRKSALVWILVFFGVEILLNASLLMDVNAFGLVGSIFQMGLISAVNILIGGFFAGGLLRQAHHRSTVRKILASLLFVIVLACIGTFNLAVGHFRDSMQAVLSDPTADILSLGNDALVRLSAEPFLLDSFQSAFLALLGILFFAVASWKWLRRDDPYPDFGRRHRQISRMRREYRQQLESLQNNLKEVYEKNRELLKDNRDKLVIQKGASEEMRLKGTDIVNEYSIQMRQYQLDLNWLLERWRTVNKDARSTPPPSYFDQEVQIDQDLLAAPTFDPPPDTPLALVMDAVHSAIKELDDYYSEIKPQYQTLHSIVREDGTI